MDMTPLICRDQKVIQSYRSGTLKISGVVYDHPVFVCPNEVLPWDIGEDIGAEDLLSEHFEIVLKRSDEIDVVLLGCGKTMVPMLPDQDGVLKAAGLSLDIMDTGAACRTYNVLMAEGRRVVCLLLPYI